MAKTNDIRADIAYHKYTVLIANIDGEEYFRERDMGAAFSKPNDILTRECSKYRRTLIANLNEFKKRKDILIPPFDDFLFNPACFVAFGNSDNVAIVPMDNFDLATRLTSMADLPVRQTSLAFCPRLKSLGITSDIFFEIDKICEPREAHLTDDEVARLLNPNPTDKSIKELEDQLTFGDIEKRVGKLPKEDIDTLVEKTKALRLPFLKERPLLAVTYYRLNGMAVLGPGLLIQQAAYKAMAERIERVIQKLGESASGNKELARSIKSFRCTFLDPQGWSDIVTIMLCRDYSVIVTVLAQLDCLTNENLFKELDQVKGKTLRDHVKCFSLNEKVAKAAERIAKDKWNEHLMANPLMGSNHIFCSTFSTLGISHEAFSINEADEAKKYYSGRVIADTNIVLCPGHFADAKRVASKKYFATLRPEKGYAWYVIGHNDLVYQQLGNETYDFNKVVDLFDFVQQIKSMRDCSIPQKPDSKTRLDTHVIEGCSELRIHIAKDIEIPRIKSGHVEIRSVFDHLKNALFQQRLKGGFNIKELRDSVRKLQLPTPLSSSVIYLYIDYANCLGDAFLFDSVLDLHDIFTTIYQLLTQRLPKAMDRKVKASYQARAFLSTEDFENLVELLGLLQNALAHRIQIAFREAERWDVTLDIRGGGFNRLLNAADVPLKCGLGLLRKVMLFDKPKEARLALDEDYRRRIGGASKISYDPKSYSHRLDIGDNPDYFLTSVDLNITHLTRPRNLLIHFHEAAHLICHFLRNKKGCAHSDYSCGRSKIFCHKWPDCNPSDAYERFTRNRYEDVFSEIVVHSFVFAQDHKTYFRNFIANYSLDPAAYPDDDDEFFCRAFEVFMRGFLITEPFRRPQLYSSEVISEVTVDMIAEASREFSTAVEDVGCFFFDFERFWVGQYRGRIKPYFEKVYKESYHPLCCIWQDVQRIHERICLGNEDIQLLAHDPPPAYIGDLDGNEPESLTYMIKRGLEKGKPLVRILFEDPRPGRDTEEYGRLDMFFLVRHLLRLHIRRLFGEIDTSKYAMCLIRKADGSPDPTRLPKGKKEWNRQLLDRNFNGLVAADPLTRGQYMLDRIVIIKTLWDISTNLRARRMCDILKIVWPEFSIRNNSSK